MKGGNRERQCVACRKLDLKEHMIRFVRVGGNAVMDASGKIQGRGAYVCRDPECLRILREKHFLRKALHAAGDEEALRDAQAVLLPKPGEVPNG